MFAILAHFLHILASPGYASGTIAVNVIRLEREFNACKMPRCIYPSIFNHFWYITIYRWRVIDFQQSRKVNERFFYHILLSPGYAPRTITVNVTRLERGFNTCKTPRCIFSSIFKRFWDIACYWSKIATFSYPLAFNAPVGGVPIGIPGKNLDLRKLESWGYQSVKTVWQIVWSPEGLPMLPIDELIFFGTTAADLPIAA